VTGQERRAAHATPRVPVLQAASAGDRRCQQRRSASPRVTIGALHEFCDKLGDEKGIGELLTYAADPVRQAVDIMLDEIDAQRRPHTRAALERRLGSCTALAAVHLTGPRELVKAV